MVGAMSERFGSGGRLISYEEGFAIGSRATGAFRAIVRGDLRRFMGEAVKLYQAIGVGVCEVLEANFDTSHFVLRLSDNIECAGLRTDKPNSQWIRGHICGGVTTALQIPMECRETRCIAMGDTHCEFEIKKVDV
jgi:predicted hydrocarbon binding protein